MVKTPFSLRLHSTRSSSLAEQTPYLFDPGVPSLPFDPGSDGASPAILNTAHRPKTESPTIYQQIFVPFVIFCSKTLLSSQFPLDPSAALGMTSTMNRPGELRPFEQFRALSLPKRLGRDASPYPPDPSGISVDQ